MATAGNSWENSLILLVLSSLYFIKPAWCLLGTLDAASRQSFLTPILSKDKKQATELQKENVKNKHQPSW